jgi:hypothetical protein
MEICVSRIQAEMDYFQSYPKRKGGDRNLLRLVLDQTQTDINFLRR